MSTALLHPSELRPRTSAPLTAKVFKMGSQIHPSRAAYEFYPTPPEATRALLAVEQFHGDVWEPACGQGHIANVLVEHGYPVIATDLVDWGYGEACRDFLAQKTPLARNIVTNPPYGRGLADAFCKHALTLTRTTGGKVAMLVALQSLCHPLRHVFFAEHPPAAVYALDECHCWPYGDASRATPSLKAQRYCWLVWRPEDACETKLQWLSTRPYRFR